MRRIVISTDVSRGQGIGLGKGSGDRESVPRLQAVYSLLSNIGQHKEIPELVLSDTYVIVGGPLNSSASDAYVVTVGICHFCDCPDIAVAVLPLLLPKLAQAAGASCRERV